MKILFLWLTPLWAAVAFSAILSIIREHQDRRRRRRVSALRAIDTMQSMPDDMPRPSEEWDWDK